MPDLTQKELDVKNEMEKERTGFFLKFTKEVEKSPQTGEPIEVTKAIVKGETGEIHIIDPALMEFMDKTE